MGLLLPPKVEAEVRKQRFVEERERRRALADRLLDFDDPVCREWEPTVRRIDPLLRLGRARPQAYVEGMNVKPGYYHWCRDNPTAGMTIEPITGPDGESFAEPDSSLLEQLQRNDLQNPVVWRAHIEQRAEREAQREKKVQADRERRTSGTIERIKSIEGASVSLMDGWSASNAGRKGRNRP